MDMPAAINSVIEKRDLSPDEMTQVMRNIMTGEATAAQIGGFLVGLRMKGETVDEITAAASVMRELATGVDVTAEHVVDIVGTGGDGSSTFNISTACTFVVAAAGGTVAKHGNRSISSKSGSADLLEAAGVSLELNAEQVAKCISDVGVGFMFAPKHHGAMKHAIGPRKEMAVRTVFNLLGPLTNPAGAPNLLLGVYDKAWVEPIAKVLKNLGSRHVMVVHSDDGMDEISIAAATQVSELKDGEIRNYKISPEDFDIPLSGLESIVVDGAKQSLDIIKSVFNGDKTPARDIVLLNSGAAIYVAGLSDSLKSGIKKAKQVIDDGSAMKKLNDLIQYSQSF
ncbi:Anthranilate phosphoribosyltransferase [hydrothermal vent metagenome]|uniref:anthranilate phosphoribosyltransferase n=1 Tax=hydrothermal vent metagenome TaxID=652676 RepID=A0A3B1AAE5_9ZZZZ